MEVNISDLTWDQFIYPRGGKSERNQVQKMQDKRILGTVGRTLLIAKRS